MGESIRLFDGFMGSFQIETAFLFGAVQRLSKWKFHPKFHRNTARSSNLGLLSTSLSFLFFSEIKKDKLFLWLQVLDATKDLKKKVEKFLQNPQHRASAKELL